MLNSCGRALSQRVGSDCNPGCNWEATPPGYSTCMRAWRRLAPHHRATPDGTYYGSPEKLENTGMLAAVANCGRSRKWYGRGRLVLGFKSRCGSHEVSFWDHEARAENLGLLFLFRRYGTLDWAEGEGRTVCLWVF